MSRGAKVVFLSEQTLTRIHVNVFINSVHVIITSKEVVCEEPLLTVDRQMGLNIVHPEGKVALLFLCRLQFGMG